MDAQAAPLPAMSQPTRHFISEPIQPIGPLADTAMMSRGLAGLPTAFRWRNREYRITELLARDKISTPEGGREGNELYLRRETFRVRLDDGSIADLYIERNPSSRTPAGRRRRWYLFTLEPPTTPPPAPDTEPPPT